MISSIKDERVNVSRGKTTFIRIASSLDSFPDRETLTENKERESLATREKQSKEYHGGETRKKIHLRRVGKAN